MRCCSFHTNRCTTAGRVLLREDQEPLWTYSKGHLHAQVRLLPTLHKQRAALSALQAHHHLKDLAQIFYQLRLSTDLVGRRDALAERLFGLKTEGDWHAYRPVRALFGGRHTSQAQHLAGLHHPIVVVPSHQHARKAIRVADKTRDIETAGTIVDLLRRSLLLNSSLAHHHDQIRE